MRVTTAHMYVCEGMQSSWWRELWDVHREHMCYNNANLTSRAQCQHNGAQWYIFRISWTKPLDAVTFIFFSQERRFLDPEQPQRWPQLNFCPIFSIFWYCGKYGMRLKIEFKYFQYFIIFIVFLKVWNFIPWPNRGNIFFIYSICLYETYYYIKWTFNEFIK